MYTNHIERNIEQVDMYMQHMYTNLFVYLYPLGIFNFQEHIKDGKNR